MSTSSTAPQHGKKQSLQHNASTTIESGETQIIDNQQQPRDRRDNPVEESSRSERNQQQTVDRRDIANPVEEWSRSERIAWDFGLLAGILILAIWPWTFFGVVSAKNGLQMSDRLAEIVSKYPQRVGAVITLIGTANQFAATFLFGQTIVRLGQELIGRRRPENHEQPLSAFRHMTLVWGIGTWNRLAKSPGEQRTRVLILFLATWGAVQLVPSGTAGLITPGQVQKTAELSETELDFTSSYPECLDWLEANRVRNRCDWKPFGNTQFTMCLGENQILDVLDSGRANMLFSAIGITNGTSSLNQLGADGGLRFLGPIKGVLPLGPDGIPAFNSLQDSFNPITDYETRRQIVSYNYTLNHQGFEANVSCVFDKTSPIEYHAIGGTNSTLVISSNGTCDATAGLQNVLEDVLTYPTLNTDNTLTYWACKQIPQPGSLDPTYFVYLRGRRSYEKSIGNITCRISPMRAQDYVVVYQSLQGYFVSQAITSASHSSPRRTFDRFVEWGLVGLGNVVWEAQNWSGNIFAEAVFSSAAKNLNLSTFEQHSEYLKLYEAMIEGVLEYQATYSRLIYSIGSNPPQNCLRDVTGSANYSVRGWFIDDSFTQAGLLLPMTLVNLASLGLLLACFFIGKFGYSLSFDMTDNLTLLTATVGGEKLGEKGEIEWGNPVKFPQAAGSEPNPGEKS
ncbi:hypothetical protein EST38_g10692 [Candolleomyces aberdarensis]|uniref:Uncharacterized protein n=1 Tax=Candolleomyces aberdarensis TaxID=2316362 RepID=A0A4Q2D8C4_9AGAR|nr:hypothetical protein EST38_g10692 [Candolleomyces aberdarensis]